MNDRKDSRTGPSQSPLQSDIDTGIRQHETRVNPFSQAWTTAKIAFTSLSIISCVIVLGISITLAVDPAIQSYIVVWTAPQAVAALTWSAAELIITFTSRRGIHPGAHSVVHSILWLAFGAGIGLTTYILAFAIAFTAPENRGAYPEYYSYYYSQDSGYEYYSKRYIRLMEALVAFLALLIIIHFFLFARACIEANWLRRMRNPPKPPEHALHELRTQK
ncbi:hypothetical protein M426DRAFT_323301 [Hypoxylon sp. CI-4A]|nr:hypothetical protein M426DRAFT_323301 [Hypoxylon sp. CI-4A]